MIEWRTVKEIPTYEVSEHGEVRRRIPAKTGRNPITLKSQTIKGGYLQVTLFCPILKKYKHRVVNRLVAIAFLGDPPSPEHQAAHNDGSKTNNHFSNLRWATRLENQRDRIKHGTHLHGIRHPNRKLEEADVEYIRSAVARKEKKMCELAAEYGLYRKTIENIVHRRSWRTVNEKTGEIS